MSESRVPRPERPVLDAAGNPAPPAALPSSGRDAGSPPALPLRPFLPRDVALSPVGSSFYTSSFQFRSAMRDAPARLVSEGRLFSRTFDARPLVPWTGTARPGPLREEETSLGGELKTSHPPGAPVPPDRPLDGVTRLPSLRPETPPRFRDSLPRVEETRSPPTP